MIKLGQRMKKIFLFVFLAVVSLLSFILISFAASFSSLKCDMLTDSSATGKAEGKLFIKGDKSRIEMNVSGMNTITIVSAQNAYMYIPAQNMAMKMDVSGAKGQVPSVGDYKNDCQYIGEDQVDGQPCGIYRCSKGGKPVTMWVMKDLDFPLKVESPGSTTHYSNIEINADLEDGLFSLPEGVQFQDVSGIMPSLQGLSNQGGN